jgi:hypothetical protein
VASPATCRAELGNYSPPLPPLMGDQRRMPPGLRESHGKGRRA